MSIIIDHVNYIFGKGTEMEHKALRDICLSIPDGQFIGIIGHTGSGKSTLMQHLNGLLKASEGAIYYNGEDIYEKGYDLKKLRSKVGLVFQYPEYQLFEVDVISDVMFGPRNQGLSDTDAKARAEEALRMVGLPEETWEKSPFELSGGQKRRAAIAGVLAMRPEVLILDEPTAGLDPEGRDDLFRQIRALHDEEGMTILLVSHSMDDVARYTDQVLVLDHGELKMTGTPEEIFRRYKELETMGLGAPQITYLVHELKDIGIRFESRPDTVDEMRDAILKLYKEAGGKLGKEVR